MSELVHAPQSGALAFNPNVVNAKINYAQQLATAGLLPRDYQRNPGNLLLAVEYAESVGIHPMTAITGLHIMNGKPTASASLISSLVRRAGHKLRVSGDDKSATAQIIRTDDPDYTFTVTWTIDMAKRAGLLGNATWGKYPEAMLRARAITQVARDACPEALNGVQYTPEELGADGVVDEHGDFVPSAGTATVPPAFVWDEANFEKLTRQVNETTDAEELRGLWKRLKDAGRMTDAVNALISERGAAITANAPVFDDAPADTVDADIVDEEPTAGTGDEFLDQLNSADSRTSPNREAVAS